MNPISSSPAYKMHFYGEMRIIKAKILLQRDFTFCRQEVVCPVFEKGGYS